MLNVKDARSQLMRARKLSNELTASFDQWNAGGGLAVVLNTRTDVCLTTVHIGYAIEPPEPFELLAGEIVGCLRKALDYLAWQVFLGGGGVALSKQATKVSISPSRPA